MMKVVSLAFVFGVIGTCAMAQDMSQEQRRARAFDTVTAQRNQAMDAVAVCVGEFQSQMEALKKELEAARKMCPAPAPTPVPTPEPPK